MQKRKMGFSKTKNSNLTCFSWIYCMIGSVFVISDFIIYPVGATRGDFITFFMAGFFIYWLISKTFKFYLSEINELNPSSFWRYLLILTFLTLLGTMIYLNSSTYNLYAKSENDIDLANQKLSQLEKTTQIIIYTLITLIFLAISYHSRRNEHLKGTSIFFILLVMLSLILISKYIQIFFRIVGFSLSS